MCICMHGVALTSVYNSYEARECQQIGSAANIGSNSKAFTGIDGIMQNIIDHVGH